MTGNTKSKVHFAFDIKKIDVVQTFKTKIEEIFDVTVHFEHIEGTWDKQWMSVHGKSCDCQDAKEYVLGLCNPEEQAIVKCQCEDEGLKFEIFRGIEKNTRVVIQEGDNDIVQISGSTLSVTLAISSLEELLGAILENTEMRNKDSGSLRLDNFLRETLSHIDNVEIDIHDYESVPSNVKRAMIDTIILDETLDNIHDDDLFQNRTSDMNRKTSYTKGLQPTISSEAGTSSQNHTAATLLKSIEDKYVDLRKSADAVGYSAEEIEEGLLYVKDVTKPTEFLPMLHNIKERKRELGLLPTNGRKVPRKEGDSQNLVNQMDSSDDNDVVITGVSHTTKARIVENARLVPHQDPNDISVIEIQDDQHMLKAEHKTQTVETMSRGADRSSASTSSSTNDKDETEVMSVWSGVIPKSSSPKNQSEDSKQQKQGSQNISKPGQTRWDVKTIDKKTKTAQVTGSSHLIIESTDGVRGVQGSTCAEPEMAVYNKKGELRYVVVDGSNVARGHGNGTVFSCLGIKLCVDYFLSRGHTKITVFVPGWRQKRGTAANPIKNQEILEDLKKKGYMAFTPHKQLPSGKRVASYDDRFILDLADKEDGVIVSNDQYRDFFYDKASYRRILEERCIPFVFVADNFMLPEDPYGQKGPMLEDILVKPNTPRQEKRNTPYLHYQYQQQPSQLYQQNYHYQQKQPSYQQYRQNQHSSNYHDNNRQQLQCHQQNSEVSLGHYHRRPENTRSQTEKHERQSAEKDRRPNYSAPQLCRERTDGRIQCQQNKRLDIETNQLFHQLKIVFCEKEQEEKIVAVLQNHSNELDINKLTNYCLNAMTF